MENPNRQFGELAVLDELAQVSQSCLSTVLDESDHVKDGLDDGVLKVVSSLVTQNTGQEGKHDSLLGWEFEAKRADGIDDDDFEFVGDVGHEGGDLLHQSVDRSFVSSLLISFANL